MLTQKPVKIQIAVVFAVSMMVFYCGAKYQEFRLSALEIETKIEAGEKTDSAATDFRAEQEMVTVHVVGAVENPGVYTFDKGSRVKDAVMAAKPNDKADLTLLNLALVLEDSRQIYVPSREEKKEASQAKGGGFAYVGKAEGKIDINTADATELQKLQGIGPALSQRIIDYRQTNGPFKSIDALIEVSGIGPVLLEKIRDKIVAN